MRNRRITLGAMVVAASLVGLGTAAALHSPDLMGARERLMAGAEAPDPGRSGAALAASCAACHGTDGRSVGGIPPLAGQPREVLVQRMLELREDGNGTGVMRQLARGYGEKEIELIADYFSGLVTEEAGR